MVLFVKLYFDCCAKLLTFFIVELNESKCCWWSGVLALLTFGGSKYCLQAVVLLEI